MGIKLLQLSGRSGCHGMGQQESTAGRQTGRGHLHDLAAVHFTDDTLLQHLLTLVAVLHESAVLLEEVCELVGAEAHTTLVGNIVIAQIFHAIEKLLVGIFLGDFLPGESAAGGSCRRQSLEHIGVKLGDADLAELTAQGLARVADHLALDLVASIDDEGEEIKTAYTPIQKLDQSYTYLEVELITGKTHQIRAHLASIEHPLVGDSKYGNADVNKHFQKKYKLENQLLHAYRLEFPILSGALENISEMVFLAPLPKEFKAILKDLR